MRLQPSRLLRRLAAGTLMLMMIAGSAAAQEAAAPRPKPADEALTAAARAQYVGTYEIAEQSGPLSFRVYEENGQLMGQPGSDTPSRLTYHGNHLFRPDAAPGASLTFTVADGKATRFVMVFPGGQKVVEAVRKK